MSQLFFFCAVVGGTVFVFQFVLMLLGVGGHHDFAGGDGGGLDVHHDFGGHDAAHDAAGHDADHVDGSGAHDSAAQWWLGLFTFRSVLAAVTFFGFGGMSALTNGASPSQALVIALACGAAALYAVGWMLRMLFDIKSEGTAHIESALGQPGTVYLTIPGNKGGVGKVTITVQERTMEYQAMTDEQELPTGSNVVVVSILGPDTVAVVPARNPERVSHA